MAKYNWGVDYPMTAGQDFSSSGQYRWVVAGSVADEVKLVGSAGGSVLGVIQNNPATGEEATVRVFGLTKIVINAEDGGSPTTFGGIIKAGSDGMALGSTNFAGGSGFDNCGIALTAVSTGSGIEGTALVYPGLRMV